MPQGLQIWDASGTMLIDTSTYVLKEFVQLVVQPVNSTVNYVPITDVPQSTIIVNAAVDSTNTSAAEIPEVLLDLPNDRFSYKFSASSGAKLKISALAF